MSIAYYHQDMLKSYTSVYEEFRKKIENLYEALVTMLCERDRYRQSCGDDADDICQNVHEIDDMCKKLKMSYNIMFNNEYENCFNSSQE